MINKVLTGIDFIDKDLDGLLQYGSYLLCGEAETGKRILTSQFLAQGLKNNEVCLLVTDESPVDYLLEVQENLGFDFSLFLQKEVFSILQYERKKEKMEGRIKQYISEVGAFVAKRGVERAVIDFSTVQDLLDETKIEENIIEFAEFLEKLHVTVIILLGKPRSPGMLRAEKALVAETVGTFRLEEKESNKGDRGVYRIEIERIAGMFAPLPSWDFEIFKKEGSKVIVEGDRLLFSQIRDINRK